MIERYDNATDATAGAERNLARPQPTPQMSVLARALPATCAAGSLTIRLPSGRDFVCASALPGPMARIQVKRWRGLLRMLAGGNTGFGQAFVDGDCTCDDLGSLFDWVLANQNMLSRFGSGVAIARWASRQYHRMNANTLRGSRRNIAAHYDLGNAFYAAWLDESMTYSSAMYRGDANRSLEAAQSAKLDRIVELLDIEGGERVLEIGCGWGALIERLTATPVAGVTALTLSHRQLDYARARVAAAGATGRAEVRLQDYRDVREVYDRIVSIEMLEAVGQQYWSRYFEVLHHSLRPGGKAVLQVITIRADRFADYARHPDFIQRYIFPGGMLPTIPIMERQIADAGLRLVSIETFGRCYARTLADWRTRFISAWPQLAEMGFDDRFRRMWTYYLAYCEAGFNAGELDVGLYQIERAKPE